MAKYNKKIDMNEFDDFLSKAGIILDWENIEKTIKINADENDVNRFKEEFKKEYEKLGQMAMMSNGILFLKPIVSLIKKYSNIINFDDLVFQTAILLEIDKKNFSNGNRNGSYLQKVIIDQKKSRNECIKNAREKLKDVNAVYVNIVEQGIQYVTSQEFLQYDDIEKMKYHKIEDKETINYENFANKVQEKIDFADILELVALDDYMKICSFPRIGLAIKKFALNKSKEITPEDKVITDIESGEIVGVFDVAKGIQDCYCHVDLKMLILIANKRLCNLHNSDFSKYSDEEIEKLNRYTDWFEEVLIELEKNDKNSRYLKEMKKIRQKVNEVNNHIILGKYHTDSELKVFSNDIITGKFDATQLTKEDFVKKIKLSDSDLKNMFMSSFDNFNYLISIGVINEARLDSIFKNINKFSTSQIVQLYMKDGIKSEKFMELFLKSDVNLEELRRLKEDESKKEEIDKLLSEKELVSLYFDDKQKEKFDKYRKLYKIIRLDNKTVDEQRENANDIIEQSDRFLASEEKMFELYHLGLIPIDTIVDYIDSPALIKLYKSGELKHEDSQRMYDTQVLTKEAIIKLLSTTGMEDDEKLVLIYSAFPDDKYTLLREELIDTVENVQITYRNSCKGGNKPKPLVDPIEHITHFEKHSMDPCAKWIFLSKLDSKFTFTYLKKDGHMVGYLPNHEKYIIEKLYDKKKGMAEKNEWAYGAATYIIDEETFEKYKDQILLDFGDGTDQVINRKKLIELKDSESANVKKVVHQGWGNAICEEFNIEESSIYTDKQREQIKKLAKQAEQAKKIIR